MNLLRRSNISFHVSYSSREALENPLQQSSPRVSVPIFGVRNVALNQYLGPVNYNMDKNSIFGVDKSEERKNHAIWCDSLVTHPKRRDQQWRMSPERREGKYLDFLLKKILPILCNVSRFASRSDQIIFREHWACK